MPTHDASATPGRAAVWLYAAAVLVVAHAVVIWPAADEVVEPTRRGDEVGRHIVTGLMVLLVAAMFVGARCLQRRSLALIAWIGATGAILFAIILGCLFLGRTASPTGLVVGIGWLRLPTLAVMLVEGVGAYVVAQAGYLTFAALRRREIRREFDDFAEVPYGETPESPRRLPVTARRPGKSRKITESPPPTVTFDLQRPDVPAVPTIEAFAALGRAGTWMTITAVCEVVFFAVCGGFSHRWWDLLRFVRLPSAAVMFYGARCLQYRTSAGFAWLGAAGCLVLGIGDAAGGYLLATRPFDFRSPLDLEENTIAWGGFVAAAFCMSALQSYTAYLTTAALRNPAVRREFDDSRQKT